MSYRAVPLVILAMLFWQSAWQTAWGEAAPETKPDRCNRSAFRVAVDVGHTV